MRIQDRFATDKEDVRRMTDAELSKLGVALQDKRDLVLECKRCGRTWSPALDANGKLPFDFWQCPRACNAEVDLQAKAAH